MVASGALPQLVELLKNGSDCIKENAAAFVSNTALRHANAVVAAAGVQACVRVLQSGPTQAKANAAGALSSISSCDQYLDIVVAAGAVEACVGVLQNGPGEAKKNAASVISCISFSEEHANAVVAGTDVCRICVAMLQNGPDSVKENIADLLANISVNEQHVDEVVSAGAVEACVDVLRSAGDLDNAKENAGGALCNILQHEHYVDTVVAAGTVEACVGVLLNGPDEAKTHVTMCLANICHHEHHVNTVVVAGAGVALISVMKADAEHSCTIAAAAVALACMSGSFKFDELIAANVANVLVKSMQEDTGLHCDTARAFSRLIARQEHYLSTIVAAGAVAALQRCNRMGRQTPSYMHMLQLP